MSPGVLLRENNALENSTLEPIAVCGMSCRLPGGVDSDSSLWRMLMEKRTGQTPKVPASRFNIDAHLHQNLERPGSFNVPGGYFLDGSPEDFDPTFFGITPVEAQWLDPQQRKMLEVSYECLESAGVTLDAIAGSNTAVFVGSFTSDYQQMSIRDPDFRHNYAATGVDSGIISNRIGNTFNLNGPSFTINTACSSSIYALHNACHALRSRDCDAAIVGGVNLIITVDQHMNTAKLGILSPTSTCSTFDASANGYGRAEGAGALYVKRLADAIRDGDPIRGVVRSTAVNTNGKVEGMGITHPSVKGQERVVRMAYDKAKLDPNLTVYAELHGTGTPVGDPIEVRAVSRAMNDTRPKDKPLLIGALKPNIGHSEAASGIFAVMKAALMTEAGIIPGVANFKTLNPEILEEEWNVKVHSDPAPWPSTSTVRRAGVSSFGYGGTNGHVIMESIDSIYPWYQHARAKKDAHYSRSSPRPFLLTLSAHDKPTLARNVAAIGAVASNYYLADLVHTLNLHRTKFSHRAFTVLREGKEAEAFLPATLQTGVASKKTPGLGFLFTGQGAQWAGMGKVALKEFPIMLDTIDELDKVLSKLNPKPAFKLADVMLSSDTNSLINEAEVTQPLCTAIQIALVDLFAQWNIHPQVSVGHSSGEIGAAYAAGLVSAPEAIIAAFCRGRAVAAHSTPGTMLAVGLGANEVQAWLGDFSAEDVSIACENSPTSVTLSGREGPIEQLRERLSAEGIFARSLPTGRAYHSPHMAKVGTAYDTMLAEALTTALTEDDLLWSRPLSKMVSSVTGEAIPAELDRLPDGYWSSNLRQRVLFNTAVQQILSDDALAGVTTMVEIGCHSALAGPFKQIRQSAQGADRLSYVASLVRNKNDADQLLCTAGALFATGYPVDLAEVNNNDFVEDFGSRTLKRKPKTQNLLVDLPPYQWNYEKKYWAEPRASAEQRGRVYPRHDLLGSRVSGLSSGMAVWRNVLRHRDVPWLKDHNLGGTAIFPAAGHLSLAIEGLRQLRETAGLAFNGVTLRDVDIKTALVVPDTDEGIEIVVRLISDTSSTLNSHAWSVESLSEDKTWTVHCEGKISAGDSVDHGLELPPHPVDESALTQRVSGKRWYDAFSRVGFNYGKAFNHLQHARTDRAVHHATGDVTICTESNMMDGESRYLVHPSTIDACLQLIIISIHAGRHKEMPWGVVPSRIEEVVLLPADVQGTQQETGHAVAWTDGFEGRKFNTNVRLSGENQKMLMDVKNLTCITYEAALPASDESGTETASGPFSIVSWKPDIIRLRAGDFERLWPDAVEAGDRLAKCTALISHHSPPSNVLIASRGVSAQKVVDDVLKILPPSTSVTVGVPSEEHESLSYEESKSCVTTFVLPDEPTAWADAAKNGPFDFVLVEQALDPNELLPLLTEKGWLLGTSDITTNPPAGSGFILQLGQQYVLQTQSSTTGAYTNGVGPRTISVLSPTGLNDESAALVGDLSNSDSIIKQKAIAEFDPENDHCVVIDDRTGDVSASILADATAFAAVKTIITSSDTRVLWLTRGTRQGGTPTNVASGTAEGLLRVIRSEQAAAKIGLLDVDTEEGDSAVATAVATLAFAETKDSGNDTEYWLRNGALHSSRVHAYDSLNPEKGTGAVRDEKLAGSLHFRTKTPEGEFVFEREVTSESLLVDDQVEIQVLASQWPSSAPGSQLLVGGTITRVGSSLDQDLIGKHAVAFEYDGLRTTVRTAAFAISSDNDVVSHEQEVSLLASVVPLVNLCIGHAKLEKNETIIALPGPENSIKTLEWLAAAMGWNLLVTSGEAGAALATIRQHYEESASGSVAVLSHEFNSNLSQEAWRCIPPSCRFLLQNELPLNIAPASLPFTRSASFITGSVKSLRQSKRASSEVLARSLELIKAHPEILAAIAVNVVDVQDAREQPSAHPTNASVPTSTPNIVRFRPGQSQVKVMSKDRHLRLSSEHTYLLVGCLGGLGRSLTRFMMDRGARHFAFLSRSGADKPEAARLVKDIQAAGAESLVFRVDAADEEGVNKVVAELQASRPIQGVVHAAMVLKDGMFEQMDHSSYASSVNPKARGAFNLDAALRSAGASPEFFVLTSSISALLGNTGQSSYSAANAALEALARRSALNATALVLPMVLDVGVVAENDAIETSLMRKGLYGIDEEEMLRGFEAAMLPRPQQGAAAFVGDDGHEVRDTTQIVMGMEPRELARSIATAQKVSGSVDAYWYDDPRFCHVRAALEAQAASGRDGAGSRGGDVDFAMAVEAAAANGPEAVLAVITSHIVKRVSSILMIPVEDFEVDGPSLASYGLDSMIGAEMRTWLFKEFGLDYPFQKLLAATLTFKKLANVVAEEMGLLPVAAE